MDQAWAFVFNFSKIHKYLIRLVLLRLFFVALIKDDNTALIEASRNNRAAIVKLLLDAGADIEAKTFRVSFAFYFVSLCVLGKRRHVFYSFVIFMFIQSLICP